MSLPEALVSRDKNATTKAMEPAGEKEKKKIY